MSSKVVIVSCPWYGGEAFVFVVPPSPLDPKAHAGGASAIACRDAAIAFEKRILSPHFSIFVPPTDYQIRMVRSKGREPKPTQHRMYVRDYQNILIHPCLLMHILLKCDEWPAVSCLESLHAPVMSNMDPSTIVRDFVANTTILDITMKDRTYVPKTRVDAHTGRTVSVTVPMISSRMKRLQGFSIPLIAIDKLVSVVAREMPANGENGGAIHVMLRPPNTHMPPTIGLHIRSSRLTAFPYQPRNDMQRQVNEAIQTAFTSTTSRENLQFPAFSALVVVPPNSGKTIMACKAIYDLFESGRIDQAVVVVPTGKIKLGWERTLATIYTDDEMRQDYPIRILCFQQLTTNIRLGKDMTSLDVCPWDPYLRSLVIIDEVHHMAAATFQHAFLHCFPPAYFAYRLMLTGTCRRSDGLIGMVLMHAGGSPVYQLDSMDVPGKTLKSLEIVNLTFNIDMENVQRLCKRHRRIAAETGVMNFKEEETEEDEEEVEDQSSVADKGGDDDGGGEGMNMIASDMNEAYGNLIAMESIGGDLSSKIVWSGGGIGGGGSRKRKIAETLAPVVVGRNSYDHRHNVHAGSFNRAYHIVTKLVPTYDVAKHTVVMVKRIAHALLMLDAIRLAKKEGILPPRVFIKACLGSSNQSYFNKLCVEINSMSPVVSESDHVLTVAGLDAAGEGHDDSTIECLVFADEAANMLQNGERLRCPERGKIVYTISHGLLNATKRAKLDIQCLKEKMFPTIESITTRTEVVADKQYVE